MPNERRRVPGEIRNVAFPVAVRGYDRRAVDAYIKRVNRVIAELEATRSPEAAVRRALERTEEERSGIIEAARAEERKITSAARQQADEIVSRARAEAADVVVHADAEADRSKAGADQHVAKSKAEAEEILADSRKEAAEERKRVEDEIATLREKADAWVRELRADTDAVWAERGDLLGELRDVAARLRQAASNAAGHDGSTP